MRSTYWPIYFLRDNISVLIRGGIHTVFENKQLASQFNFDDVLSTNNPGLENYFGQIYPAEFDKEKMESNTSTSLLDLLLSIGRGGQLCNFFYDKRDDLNIYITNSPFLRSNIPSLPAYDA